MGNKLKHIVQVFFDVELPTGFMLSRDFVEYRYSFFKKYTYCSLMNQTFKDFEIWLFCGHRHREFTSQINLDNVMFRKVRKTEKRAKNSQNNGKRGKNSQSHGKTGKKGGKMEENDAD